MTLGDVTGDEFQDLAARYLELQDELKKKYAQWLDLVQEKVDAGEISYEAAELYVEFSAADMDEAADKTLRRGLMFPSWRPDTLGAEVLDRPDDEEGEEDGD